MVTFQQGGRTDANAEGLPLDVIRFDAPNLPIAADSTLFVDSVELTANAVSEPLLSRWYRAASASRA